MGLLNKFSFSSLFFVNGFVSERPIKDQAHVKTLGKWFNDVYNKRELYSYSKRLSLYVYKNKTNKNTADKCIKTYYVS